MPGSLHNIVFLYQHTITVLFLTYVVKPIELVQEIKYKACCYRKISVTVTTQNMIIFQ